MAPWLLLAFGAIAGCFTFTALARARRLSFFVIPYFFAGWLTSELAIHHIVWQAAAVIGFVLAGALDQWPGWVGLATTALSWVGLLEAHGRARGAAVPLGAALEACGADAIEKPPLRSLLNPFGIADPRVEKLANIPYGEPLPGDKGGRNLLDVLRPRTEGARRPVLIHIHGGAWVIGEKEWMGQPLMNHMAAQGWVCFAPNYRLCPRARFPDPIVDVKRAVAWVREHAEEYGADPSFICVAGGSAGGHLAALLALTAGDSSLQPGFEQADTSVAACVPFYGIYDLLDRRGFRAHAPMSGFLESRVLRCSPVNRRDVWEAYSPLSRIHSDAPPFLIVHGSHDSFAYVEDARAFSEDLRAKSRNPVLLAELYGGQHAFETFLSLRSAYAVRAVASFLERVRRTHDERSTPGIGGTRAAEDS